jgi:hypothetical protein
LLLLFSRFVVAVVIKVCCCCFQGWLLSCKFLVNCNREKPVSQFK